MNILETKGLYHDFKGLEVLFDVNLDSGFRRNDGKSLFLTFYEFISF